MGSILMMKDIKFIEDVVCNEENGHFSFSRDLKNYEDGNGTWNTMIQL